ncbi:hypothetical protein [Streptomyces sp. NPDC001307]|uniref:hypothetical protein n=1 Tax=Streptomyces sp. NPDC001307 TaxID=3364560 RepID=UPI00367E886B
MDDDLAAVGRRVRRCPVVIPVHFAAAVRHVLDDQPGKPKRRLSTRELISIARS